MSYLNIRDQVLEAKVVYYGAGLSGKTTNLVMIRHRITDGRCGEMMSLNTDGDRTLFFDWLPLSVGRINGCNLKMQLYTVPGQAKYVETRKRVLRYADGVVLVLDSASGALDKNREIVAELRQHVHEFDLQGVPLVVQLNKRDLPSAMARQSLLEALDLVDVPTVEAVASEGRGVLDTLKLATRLVMAHVRKEILDDADSIGQGEDSRLDGQTLYEQLEGISARMPMRVTSAGARRGERVASGGGSLVDVAVEGDETAALAMASVGAASPRRADAGQPRSRVVALPAAPRTQDVTLSAPSAVDTDSRLSTEDLSLLREVSETYRELGARLSKLERVVVETSRLTLAALGTIPRVDGAAAIEGGRSQLDLLVSISKRLEQLIANLTCVEADQEVLRVRVEELSGEMDAMRDQLDQAQQTLAEQPGQLRECFMERLGVTQSSIEDLLRDQGTSHCDDLTRLGHDQRQSAEQTGGQLREMMAELRRLAELLLDGKRGINRKRWW